MLLRSGRPVKAEPTVWAGIVSLLCFQGAALAFLWRFVREHGVGWSGLFGFANDRKRAMASGILVAIIFLPVGLGLKQLTSLVLAGFGIDAKEQTAVEMLSRAGPIELAALFVAAVVLAPLAEEFLFRGVLYPVIKQAGYPKLALWVTSVLFAVIHVNLVTLLPLLVLAIVLVQLYEQTDNLLAPIMAHTTFNVLNFAVFLWVKHGGKLPPQP